jgi:hypothetical protein
MLPLPTCSSEAKLPEAQLGNKSHPLIPAKPAAAAGFTFKALCFVRNPRTLQPFVKLRAGNREAILSLALPGRAAVARACQRQFAVFVCRLFQALPLRAIKFWY